MEKVIQNDMKLELFEMIDQNVTFDHAIINWPARVGDWPAVSTWFDLKDTITATMTAVDKLMSADGLVTVFYWGDAETAMDDWLTSNPGCFENVQKFRVWSGNRITGEAPHLVHMAKKAENYKWATFRRVGSSATPSTYTFPDHCNTNPDDTFDVANVTLDTGGHMWPYESYQPGEIDMTVNWKINNNLPTDAFTREFKFHLLEDNAVTDPKTFVQIPKEFGTWDVGSRSVLPFQQREFLINAYHGDQNLPGTRHVISGEKHRSKDIWFYYWWLQTHLTSSSQNVFIPFTGDGDAIMASLLNGNGFYGVENNVHRAKIGSDIVKEYRIRFPKNS